MELTNNHRILLGTLILLAIFVSSYAITLNQIEPTGAAAGNIGVIIVSPPTAGQCNITMIQEWNYISICGTLTNRSIPAVLDDIDGLYDYILLWNQSTQEFSLWSKYSNSNPYSIINENYSYFVHMTNNGTLRPGDATSGDLNLSLLQNWTNPAYPYEFNASINKSLKSIDGNYTYVLKWNNTQQKYKLYSIFSQSPEFTQIYAGEGQFIYINKTSSILSYNRTDLAP